MSKKPTTYRRISIRMWRDKKTRQMTAHDLVIWWYLLTGPHSHMSGLYFLPMAYIAHDLGFTDLTINDGALDHLIELGLLHYCNDTDIVYIPNMAGYQGVNTSPKILANIQKHLDEIDDCELKDWFIRDNKDLIGGCDRVSHTVSDTVSQGYSIQDPDPDPDPEIKTVKPISHSQKSETQPKKDNRPVSTIGNVTAIGMIDLPKPDPKPRTPPHNPWTVELRELQQYYADTWSTPDKHIPINPKPVNGDLKRRMSYALAEYGYKDCQSAIRGHHALATAEGSQRGRSIDKAFPEGSKRGRRDSSRLDTEGFYFFVNAAPKSSKEKRKEDIELSKKHTPKPLTEAEHKQRQEQIKKAKAIAFGGKGAT